MNKQAELNRVLSRMDVIVLAFGAMIGWGWVILSGDWIQKAGSLGAMIAFVLGGILVVFVGLVYAELTTALPKTGGVHHFALSALGSKAAFIVSWSILLGYISVVAFEAVALPTVVEYIFPNYQVGYLWTIAGWDVYFSWVAIGVVGSLIVTIINWFGVKQAAFLQLVLTILLAAVGLALILGSTFGGEVKNMDPLFSAGLTGVMAVMIMTPFMFVGFDVIPQMAEEMNIPKKTIGKILLLSVGLAVAWYVLIIFGVSLSLNEKQLLSASLPTADAMGAVFGAAIFSKMLILGGIAGIMTSWNAFIIGGSRVMYAMAQDGMLPKWFCQIHPKYKTPGNAILVIGLLSSLAPLLGRPALVWLVDAGGLSIVIAYFIVSISFLVLRKTQPELERPFRAGKNNIVGILATILSLGFVFLYMPGMPASLVWPYEWFIFGVWWIIGLFFFLQTPSIKSNQTFTLHEESLKE